MAAWHEKPPGLTDRAAAILALSPPIYDYVVISHAGAPPSLPSGQALQTIGEPFLLHAGATL
jgi:hypothetical protein